MQGCRSTALKVSSVLTQEKDVAEWGSLLDFEVAWLASFYRVNLATSLPA